MKLKELIPLQRYKLPYDIVSAYAYEQEHYEEFKLNEELYEALEKSYPREDVIARLQAKFHVYIYPPQYDAQNILIDLEAAKEPPIHAILQFVGQQGWFVSSIDIDDKVFNGDDQTALTTLINLQYRRAILIIETTHNEIPTPEILYHTTLQSIWETKIKLYGLSPKSKSVLSAHPERVYFTTSLDIAIKFGQENAKQKLAIARGRRFDPTKFNPEEYYKHWIVLQIDTSKIPRTQKRSYFRVHQDPNMDKTGPGMGLFSQNYIPPAAITAVRQFDAY